MTQPLPSGRIWYGRFAIIYRRRVVSRVPPARQRPIDYWGGERVANKLAGQRAKFSRAKSNFFTSSEDDVRQRAIQLMAEVLIDAPSNGFTEAEVTQGEDVPDLVREQLTRIHAQASAFPKVEDDDALVFELNQAVDTKNLIEIGDGEQSVYAYGYPCAPDRLKIGSCSGDVAARIAAQIGTSSPDRPSLMLIIRTHDCRALERAFHGVFRLQGKQIEGGGAEWFQTSREEIVRLYGLINEGGAA